MHGPSAGLGLRGKPHALKPLQAPDQQQTLALQFGFVEALDLHQAVHRLALEGAIQARPPLLFHFAG